MNIKNYENKTPTELRFISLVLCVPTLFLTVEYIKLENFIFILFLICFVACLLFTINVLQDTFWTNRYNEYLSSFSTEKIYDSLNGNENNYETKKLLKQYLKSIDPNQNESE
jgi:hypothetical protein